jgi:hypothetical protein
VDKEIVAEENEDNGDKIIYGLLNPAKFGSDS